MRRQGVLGVSRRILSGIAHRGDEHCRHTPPPTTTSLLYQLSKLLSSFAPTRLLVASRQRAMMARVARLLIFVLYLLTQFFLADVLST
jgi:hypothetical protein